MKTDELEYIIAEIKELYIDCPECESIEDVQYQCTTCWANGRLNVFNFLKDHIDIIK